MIEAVYASATYPAPRAAAWAIHLAYPVALEKTVATEIESTDLRMEVIRARLLRRLSARSALRLRLSARRLPAVGGLSAFQLVVPPPRHERKPDPGRVHCSCAAERGQNGRKLTS